MQATALGMLSNAKMLHSSVQIVSLPDQSDLDPTTVTEFSLPRYDASARHVYLAAPALCVVAYFGLATLAEALILAQPTDIDQRCSHGRTPLHYASGSGHMLMMRLLLDKGADVNAADKDGVSALHLASISGKPDAVELLADAGAKTEARTTYYNDYSDYSYSHPLHWAALQGRDVEVRSLLAKGAEIECGNAWRRSPLHLATRHSHLTAMKTLIARGADVNSERDGRGTPLCWAVEHGHQEAAKLLLDSGAKMNLSSYQGAPLEVALSWGKPHLVAFLRTYTAANEDPVRFAIRSAVERQGQVGRAHAELPKLLELAAEKMPRDRLLGEELAAALQHPNFQSVTFLISLGAGTGQVDAKGRTIMHMSLHWNRFYFFHQGLSAGLDYRVPDIQGCQPFHHAAAGNCAEGVLWLLDKGLDADMTDDNGWTALHWAALQGHLSLVDVLVHAGCDTTLLDRQGRTAYDVALQSRPSDEVLLRQLSGVQDETVPETLAFPRDEAEATWYLLCNLTMSAHQAQTARLPDGDFDLQWDKDHARRIGYFCDFQYGQCGNDRWALLWSDDNARLCRAWCDIMDRSGYMNSLLSVDQTARKARNLHEPKRVAFCDGCQYVSTTSFFYILKRSC